MYYYKHNIKLKFCLITSIFIIVISSLYIFYEKLAIETILIPRYFYYHNDILESYKKYLKKNVDDIKNNNNATNTIAIESKKFFKNFDLLDTKIYLKQKLNGKSDLISINKLKIIKYSNTKNYENTNRNSKILGLKRYIIHCLGHDFFDVHRSKENDKTDIVLITDVIIDYKSFYANKSSVLKTMFKLNDIPLISNEIKYVELISDVTLYVTYIRKSLHLIINMISIFYLFFCINLLVHYLEIKRIIKVTNEKIAKYSMKVSKIENFKDIKRVFLANITHELRTPMCSIIGYTEIIIDFINNNYQKNKEEMLEEIKYYSNNILVSSNKLLSLIEDFLDLSKTQLNSLSLEYSFLSINQKGLNSVY